MSKIQVVLDSIYAGKIVEIELTRDLCEGILAITEVIGYTLGEKQQLIKSGMWEVLNQIPKDHKGYLEVPLTGEMAVSVLSLCLFVKEKLPTGDHLDWLDPLLNSLTSAIQREYIRCKVLFDDMVKYNNLN